MLAAPRAFLFGVVAALIMASLPTALADGCIVIDADSFANGLGIQLTPTSDALVIGVRAGDPGDGILLKLIIKPSLCPGGFGVGSGGNGVVDPFAVLDSLPIDLPPLIPLP